MGHGAGRGTVAATLARVIGRAPREGKQMVSCRGCTAGTNLEDAAITDTQDLLEEQ